jgi:phage tail tube protein FII
MGLDSGALDASMVVGGVVEELILKYGGDIDEMRLRFVGEIYSGATHCWKLRCAGVSPKSIQVMPSRVMTPTTPTPSKTYYKLSVDDKPLLEIDLLNFIYKRNGRISTRIALCRRWASAADNPFYSPLRRPAAARRNCYVRYSQ